jgi:hypothetical protein
MSTGRPNASHSKRHESFAASAVLPGENREEFDLLVTVLRDRLEPVGYLEEELVVSIAELSWRKRRLGIFRTAANVRARFGAYFAEGDVELGVIRFYQHKLDDLRIMAERKLKTWPLIEEWKKALAEAPDIGGTEPHSKSEGKPREDAPDQEGVKAENCLKSEDKSQASDQVEIQFAILGDLISPECYLQELELAERLDAGIERTLDRLAKYQARRTSGSLPGSDRRNQRWGRVRS